MRLTVLPRLRDRVYSDFLMGSRLGAYRRLLEAALRNGDQISSVGIVWRLIGDSGLDPTQCHLVPRHDVHTDPHTADAMRHIERGLSAGDPAPYGCPRSPRRPRRVIAGWRFEFLAGPPRHA